MTATRRQFFKSLAALGGLFGLPVLANAGETTAVGKRNVFDGSVTVEWLGHGSFLFISSTGKRILFDPWISTNPKCPGKYRQKGGFDSIDFILWTHGHVDHFMLSDARELITRYQPKVIAPWELNFFIKSEIPETNNQTFVIGNKGCTSTIDGIKFTMLEAFHSAGAQLTGFEGTNRFVGEAVGYLIEFENGLKVYHSGDTSLMGDMKTIIGDYYQPDVAILPIGGVFTMGPEEAAYACTLIRPKMVIPEHFGTFPVLEPTCDSFRKHLLATQCGTKVVEPQPGVAIKI